MARPRHNPVFEDCAYQEEHLVREGSVYKVTLARVHGQQGPCHVDWLRVSFPRARLLETGRSWFESERINEFAAEQWWGENHLTRTFARAFGWDGRRARDLARCINQVEREPAKELLEACGIDGTQTVPGEGSLLATRLLAHKVVQLLGPGFSTQSDAWPGRDFYGFRVPIFRNGVEVGHVLGGTSSPNGQHADKQSETVHLNLYGTACLFGAHAMPEIADLGEHLGGWITRCDLAVDLFDGMPGGVQSLQERHLNGEMDHRGRRPNFKIYGDTTVFRECTVYIGSRLSGKYSRFYQKGDQMIGLEANDPWFRGEVEYRNNQRILDWDMLRRPAEFFAGASKFHAWFLEQAGIQVPGESMPVVPRAQAKQVEAEVESNLQWLQRIAAPSIRAVLDAVGSEALDAIALHAANKAPGRLLAFSRNELSRAYEQVAGRHQLLNNCPAAFKPVEEMNADQLSALMDRIEHRMSVLPLAPAAGLGAGFVELAAEH